MSTGIRLLCEKLGIRKVDASEKVIYLTVADKPKFEPLKFIDLMQSRARYADDGPEPGPDRAVNREC